MFDYASIRNVHLEITDKCNASCPMCARNISGGPVNPNIPLTELSLDDIKKIFPEDFVKQLDLLFMCGNYGDPIVAKDTLATYDYLRTVNPNIRLGMNTNASARSPKWWKELARIQGDYGYVVFSVDGLSDTNHLYRRGTNFEKIMENAAAFIEAGGNAMWDYIVFRHNEHQVEQAEMLSDAMGFKQFRVKKTSRDFNNGTRKEVYDRNGNFEYYIEMPLNHQYQNNVMVEISDIMKKNKDHELEKYYDRTNIDCKVIKANNVYISCEGFVLPCCWISQFYNVKRIGWKRAAGETQQILELINDIGGMDMIDATKRSVNEIMNGPLFTRISDSWGKNSITEGKFRVCARTCGEKYDRYKSTFE